MKRVIPIVAFVLAANASNAVSPDVHIECAILERCIGTNCNKIAPAPVLLRYVGSGKDSIVYGYGSADVIGGPSADASTDRAFGVKIPDGKSIVLTRGMHGQNTNGVWFDLFATRHGWQRLFVDGEILRTAGDQCVTRAEIHAGQPQQRPTQVIDGYLGECRWSQNFCTPNNKTQKQGN